MTFQAMIVRLCMPALAVLTLVGCATQRVDWDSRVGAYNYDQAVLELGPPDKSAQLTDGTRVAEWMTSKGSPAGMHSIYLGGPFSYAYMDASSPDYFIRLTFLPDGRLQSWKKVAR